MCSARRDDQRRKNGALREGGHSLGHTEIAWQLGKRFGRDEALGWGCAVDRAEEGFGVACAWGRR
jgi:hypothetical protein